MQKVISFEWVRSIKKYMDYFNAADTFGDFLSLGLGKSEQLSGYEKITYSIRVSSNIRLIIELIATTETINTCNQIVVKGVCDYHGDKYNWYIP